MPRGGPASRDQVTLPCTLQNILYVINGRGLIACQQCSTPSYSGLDLGGEGSDSAKSPTAPSRAAPRAARPPSVSMFPARGEALRVPLAHSWQRVDFQGGSATANHHRPGAIWATAWFSTPTSSHICERMGQRAASPRTRLVEVGECIAGFGS